MDGSRRVAAVCGSVLVGLGITGLLHSELGWGVLGGLRAFYAPMALSTKVAFVILGTALLVHAVRPARSLSQWSGRIAGIAVLLLSCLALVTYARGGDLGSDQLLQWLSETPETAATGHLSPITAASFLLGGSALLLLSLAAGLQRRAAGVASGLAIAPLSVGLVAALGYLYKAPLLYGKTTVQIALPTAAGLVCLGVGLLAVAGSDHWPIRAFTGATTRTRLLRAFLPYTLAIVVAQGWLNAVISGPIRDNPTLLSAMLVILSVLVMSVVISHTARALGSALERAQAQRLRAEEELRGERDCISAILDTAGALVVVLDQEGRIERFNRACEEASGYSLTEVSGKRIWDLPLLALEDMGPLKAVFRELRAGLPARRYENHWVNSGQAQRLIAWSHTALRDGNGAVVHQIATGMDITERKQAEEAVREARRRAEEALRREQQIAARFQSALLPQGGVCLPGYSVAYAHHPALAEADVGGDFYNVFAIDEERVGLVMGDVGGKGLEAAVIAARVQHSIAAIATREPHSPAAVLDATRHMLSTCEDEDRLVTVFFGVLHLTTGGLRYTCAGHEPPLLWQATENGTTALLTDGIPFCGLPAAPHTTREITLSSGDVLLLYTDGLTDAGAGTGKELLGRERVQELLSAHQAEHTAHILDDLYHTAVRYSEGRLHDDIALLVIRRLSEAQSPEQAAEAPACQLAGNQK